MFVDAGQSLDPSLESVPGPVKASISLGQFALAVPQSANTVIFCKFDSAEAGSEHVRPHCRRRCWQFTAIMARHASTNTYYQFAAVRWKEIFISIERPLALSTFPGDRAHCQKVKVQTLSRGEPRQNGVVQVKRHCKCLEDILQPSGTAQTVVSSRKAGVRRRLLHCTAK